MDSINEFDLTSRDYRYKDLTLYNNALNTDQTEVQSDLSLQNFSLVIPAYNEEKRIGPFLRHLSGELPKNWEVIIVCDGTDNTANIAKEIDPGFKVLEFKERLGKGGAIAEGFKVSGGDVLGYADADGAVSFKEISKVFRTVSGDCDVAVGSRWVRGSIVQVRQPILRIVLGRLYHYMSFAILGLRTKDTQCGVKAFRISTIRKLMMRVTLKNLSFDTAILYHCKKMGSNIAEIPITWIDINGSKVKPFKTSIVMFFSLIGLRLANSRISDRFRTLIDSARNLLENA